jgi:glutamate 5-kinase
VSHLRERAWGVIIVASGAVGCGRLILADAPGDSLCKLPATQATASDKKALAALGQGRLMSAWEAALAVHGLHIAQFLMGRADICDKARYANTHATVNAILSIGAVAVINENDTVSSAEYTVGDNDNLSALTASMCSASLLVLLTDVDGLYTANPNTDPNAVRIPIVRNVASIGLRATLFFFFL